MNAQNFYKNQDLLPLSRPRRTAAKLSNDMLGYVCVKLPDQSAGGFAPPIPRTARRGGVRGELSNWFFQLIGQEFFFSGMILFLRGSW